jgi:signal transduction histidine kinase
VPVGPTPHRGPSHQFRAKNSQSVDDRQSGFGLGLAIAKQAVDAHGGAIRVQDLPGKGCIFVLELPVGIA